MIDKNSLTNDQKEAIIAQALNTDEGRVALAQARSQTSPPCVMHGETKRYMQESPETVAILTR